jgi:hypothetical protein
LAAFASSSFLEQVYMGVPIGDEIQHLFVFVCFGVLWNKFDVMLYNSECSWRFGGYLVARFFPIMVVKIVSLKSKLLGLSVILFCCSMYVLILALVVLLLGALATEVVQLGYDETV